MASDSADYEKRFAGHTPGEWRHVGLDGGWDGVADESGQVICRLVLNVPVNATLLAAAPALLSANTSLRAEVERLRDELLAAATALTAAGLRFGKMKRMGLAAQETMLSAQRARAALAPAASATEGEG
jgi:hypothetical protein